MPFSSPENSCKYDIFGDMTPCTLCPRLCAVDRRVERGYCGMGTLPVVARAAKHFWEEPCLAGSGGSGAVFFSGCSLRCVFCQNHTISHEGRGEEITAERLCSLFEALQNDGADNIDLVTPTHFAPLVARALSLFAPKKRVPVIWNSSGYERAETILRYCENVDIFLPDLKYASPALSARYSGAGDYFAYAQEALSAMFSLVGYPKIENGRMTRGVLIRHLVLPSHSRESLAVIDHLVERYDPEKLYVSFLCQYFPAYKAKMYPEIDRRLTTLEYRRVLDYAVKRGIRHGFSQERSSAKEEYVPTFYDKLPDGTT